MSDTQQWYAFVEKYSNGDASFPFASPKWLDGKFCAGEYESEEEALEAAKTLRALLQQGDAARKNREYATRNGR